MYDGSFADGDSSSCGSYYTHMAANVGTSLASINYKTDLTYNVCAKNWTLPSEVQARALINVYSGKSSQFNGDFPISASCRTLLNSTWYNNTETFWTRTTASRTNAQYFAYVYASADLASSMTMTDYCSRSLGGSLRCQAK